MEAKPTTPGSQYGQRSAGGEWMWAGTGRPDDAWVSVAPSAAASKEPPPAPTPHAPPAAGTAIPSNTTIDALFTALYGTRSSHTTPTATYKWVDVGRIEGVWPDGSHCTAWLEARPLYPAVLRL
jgi:hypothetical protein